MSFVEIRDLRRSFGVFTAVDDVSFGFEKGEIFGFIGPNGAGKTTTMRILATLDVPDSGDALVGGVSVVDHPDLVRPRIGFLPDYYGTYPNTTVLDYLDFYGRSYGLRGAQLARRMDSVIAFTGLGGLREKATTALSKGMKQRLALGRLLLHDPDLMILDEPAAGLDPRARIEFRELVKLLAEQGKAIMISSHILTELSEFVDGCAIVERGRIVRSGSVEDLRAHVRGAGTPNRIRLALAEPRADAEAILLQQPFVQKAFGSGRNFAVEIEGGRPEIAAFLRAIVLDGLDVVDFRSDESNLEDLFMAVTRGEVT